MTTTLRFLGAAGFEILGPRHRILMDPFLRDNPVAPVQPEDLERPDLILVSHAAHEHMGDAAEIARRSGAPVVCPGDVALKMIEEGVPAGQVRATVWGICYEFGDVIVRPVECRHWSMTVLRDGRRVAGVPLSFIVEPEQGVRIYHFGDTAIFDGMKMIGELYRPTIGLLGVAQTDGLPDPGAGRIVTGEMNPDEAALAAEWLGLRHAVATHYMSIGPEVAEFRKRVAARDTTGRRVVHAPDVGETLSFETEEFDLPSLAWGVTSAEWDHGHRPKMAPGPHP
jgi:L-ascorbate metabolism protein UlaG (beta-lactamase superfamily)